MSKLIITLVVTLLAITLLGAVACGESTSTPTYTPRPSPSPTPMSTPTSIPTPTPSQYRLFLMEHPEASEGFTEDEYELAEEHIRRTPEVINEPELWEAFNAKVKIEEDLLKDLDLYPPSEADWDEIILANWSDVYDRLYKGGEAYGGSVNRCVKGITQRRAPLPA